MYMIIRADGKTYGPETAEQLRQWIAEGRLPARTQTFAAGAREWKPLGAPPGISTAGRLSKTSSFATAGLICGSLSLVACCCYGFPFNVLGLVFSLIGWSQIARNPERYDGLGLASGSTGARWHWGSI